MRPSGRSGQGQKGHGTDKSKSGIGASFLTGLPSPGGPCLWSLPPCPVASSSPTPALLVPMTSPRIRCPLAPLGFWRTVLCPPATPPLLFLLAQGPSPLGPLPWLPSARHLLHCTCTHPLTATIFILQVLLSGCPPPEWSPCRYGRYLFMPAPKRSTYPC